MIASAGLPKREFLEKRITPEAEELIERRNLYRADGSEPITAVADATEFVIGCLMPIMAEGDVIGCVASLLPTAENRRTPSEIECKLVESAAGFLGKQLEP